MPARYLPRCCAATPRTAHTCYTLPAYLCFGVGGSAGARDAFTPLRATRRTASHASHHLAHDTAYHYAFTVCACGNCARLCHDTCHTLAPRCPLRALLPRLHYNARTRTTRRMPDVLLPCYAAARTHLRSTSRTVSMTAFCAACTARAAHRTRVPARAACTTRLPTPTHRLPRDLRVDIPFADMNWTRMPGALNERRFCSSSLPVVWIFCRGRTAATRTTRCPLPPLPPPPRFFIYSAFARILFAAAAHHRSTTLYPAPLGWFMSASGLKRLFTHPTPAPLHPFPRSPASSSDRSRCSIAVAADQFFIFKFCWAR